MEAIQQDSFSIPQPKVLKKIKRKQAGQGFVANCMTTMNGSNKMFTPRPTGTGTCSSMLDRKRKTVNTSGEGSPSLSNKRQSLKVLQLTAGNQKGLIGRIPTYDQDIKKLNTNLVRDSNDKNERNVMKKDQKSCSSKRGSKKTSLAKSVSKTSGVNIFVDPTHQSSSDSSSSEPEKQTNTNDDIYAMMTKDEAPETYWKEIAEERRKALTAALDENKNLHNELNDLQTDYDQLKKVAEQAEYFAGIIEDLLGKKVDESSDGDEEVSSESNTEQTTSECRKRKRDDDDDDETGSVHKEAKLYSSDEEEAVENVEDDEDEEENSLFGSYV